jgi:hypothetical protein
VRRKWVRYRLDEEAGALLQGEDHDQRDDDEVRLPRLATSGWYRRRHVTGSRAGEV